MREWKDASSWAWLQEGNVEKDCFLSSCPYGNTHSCGSDCCKWDHFYPLQKGQRGCFQQRWPWHSEAGACTLHRCLIDQAVLSPSSAADIVGPAAALPIRALAQREAPGGVATVAFLPSDHCQRELLQKRENRSVCKCHGINSLQGMMLPCKENKSSQGHCQDQSIVILKLMLLSCYCFRICKFWNSPCF